MVRSIDSISNIPYFFPYLYPWAMQMTVDVLKNRSNGVFSGRLSQLFFIISTAVPESFIFIDTVRLLFSLTTTSENRCSVYTYSSTFWPHIICSAFILRSCYISVYRWISFKLESHCTSWAFWIGRTKYKSNWLCIHPRNRYRNKTHSVLRYSNRKTCICIISIFCSKLFWKIYDGKLLAI